MLAVTLAAGCFDGGSGYSNYPYDYNGGRENRQSYQNSNSDNAGYQNGIRTDEERDGHQNRDNDDPVVVTHDRDQTRPEKQPPSVDHDAYYPERVTVGLPSLSGILFVLSNQPQG
jgi:hypothetical protein